jgi:hypothetical protein
MPFRREKAQLRTRSSATEQAEDPALGSKWRKMNYIESLQYGLAQGLHKKEGWLWNCLLRDGVVEDTQAAKRERCWNAYQAQKIFVMAQQQIMPEGWDPRSPSNSVKVHRKTGQFVSLQTAKNPVPANVVTNSFLRYAYGVPKETFRRWIGEGGKFQKRVPHNKGKNVIDDKEMAKKYFTPFRMYMQHELALWRASDVGRDATLHDKRKQTQFLTQHYKSLPEDIMEVYKKSSREKLALHGFIEEAIVETLNDNSQQAYNRLHKVNYMSAI